MKEQIRITEKSLNSVFYICGAGGTGKTSLIQSLLAENRDFIPGDVIKLDRKRYDRNKLWEGYAEDTFKYACEGLKSDLRRLTRLQALAIEKPSKLILADRCVLDTLAYILAAERFGDLSSKESSDLFKKYVLMFKGYQLPKKIILLAYPKRIVLSRISARAKSEGQSFRDSEPRYHQCVLDSFDTIFSLVPHLRVTNLCNARDNVLNYIRENCQNTHYALHHS